MPPEAESVILDHLFVTDLFMVHFRKSRLVAFAAGLSCVFGFAPFGGYLIPVLALAVLFALWQREGCATDAGSAADLMLLHADTSHASAWLGFYFGLGLFGAGIGWIYVALHDYGDMPLPLAALATLLFAAFLALFLAFAGKVQARLAQRISPITALALLMPAIWVLVEWTRGMIFTGFPWLAMGYAHTDSPLAGYASLFGVYGVSLIAAVSSGLLVIWWRERWSRMGRLALAVFAGLWLAGAGLRMVAWTQPQGEPFSVALVQGNFAQELKFDRDRLVETLEIYRYLTLQSDARLTVLPETAFPLLRQELPQVLVDQFVAHAREQAGGVLFGTFAREGEAFHNSVFAITGSSDEQRYHKQHLVPFGEFIPLRPVLGWFINEVLNIPMGDLSSGGTEQPLLDVAEQRVAVNICYEDVFGEEIIRSLPQASLLVNVTNDAWYGNSHAAEQHNQISRMRALETGRMMLRATNTGVTSIIGVDGRVLQQLPQHQTGVLRGMAQGYEGATPYVRWGNAGVMLLIFSMLALAWRRRSDPISDLE